MLSVRYFHRFGHPKPIYVPTSDELLPKLLRLEHPRSEGKAIASDASA